MAKAMEEPRTMGTLCPPKVELIRTMVLRKHGSITLSWVFSIQEAREATLSLNVIYNSIIKLSKLPLFFKILFI